MAVDPGTRHTYLRTDEALSAYDADALARQMGGTLVSIASAEEETFLLENFGASELYWIGLEYPRRAWADGSPVGFAHWFPGEPAGNSQEPFTLMNWSDPGAWVDVSGDVASEHHRALIELPSGVSAEDVPRLPARRGPGCGVLLCALEGLTQKDLENPRLSNLNALWKSSAWTDDAAADGSGDPLAGLGMLFWGVGSARSGLSVGAPQNAARGTNVNLLSRLEAAQPEITTAALLDDPALAGILLDGRVDLRVSNASPRRGGSDEGLRDALARPTPLCLVATWTTPEITGGEPLADSQRAKDIAGIDKELGTLLETLRARPQAAEERWWIALCGISPAKGKKTRPEDLRARSAVPLCVVGSALPAGELLADISVVDLVPSALLHLGIEPRRSFALDGLALERVAGVGSNLIANGGAEAQFDWNTSPFPTLTGWRQLASFRLGRYGADTPGPPEHGDSYFQGVASPLARMEQTIDLRALAQDIDRGGLRYRLSGWLGVGSEASASIELAAEFLSEQKKTLERVVLGPVGAGEKRAKDEPPGPRELATDGRLPRRTRAVRLVLTAAGERGVERTFADELSLILTQE